MSKGNQKSDAAGETAGLVVLRTCAAGPEVIMTQSPDGSGWTLPKGEIQPGELPPEAACRVFTQATGCQVVVGCPINASGASKHWWIGQLSDPSTTPTGATWRSTTDALAALKGKKEHDVLAEALSAGPTRTMLLVRHAKTEVIEEGETDPQRPLLPLGERQAAQLVHILAAYGVGALAHATSLRCGQTLQPYAELRHIEPQTIQALEDANAKADPAGLVAAMQSLRADVLTTGTPLAVCGHGPRIAAMAAAVGQPDIGHAPVELAETIVLHLDTNTGKPQAFERYQSLAS